MKVLTEMQLNVIIDWMQDNQETSHWVSEDLSGVELIQSIMNNLPNDCSLDDIETYLKEQ